MYFLDMLLQWFYPPRCVLCGKLIKIGEKNGICIDCENTISWKEGAVCQKCGCNLYTNETYCERCKEELQYFLIVMSEKRLHILNFATGKEMQHLWEKLWQIIY